MASRRLKQGVGFGVGGVTLLAICHFSAFVDRTIPSVYAPSLKASFALTDTELGTLQGPAFVLVYAIGALATGWRGARLPLGPVLAGCVLLWTTATICFALSSTYEALLVARLGLGLGQAAFAPLGLMALMAAVPADRLAQATSVFTTGSATGRSGGLLIGGALLAAFSTGAAAWLGAEPWRIAILAMVAPNLVLAWLLLRRLGPARLSPPPQGGLREAAARILSHPGSLGLHFLAAGALIILVQAGAAWAPSIVNRSLAMTPAASAVLVGAVVLVAAPAGHLGAGWLLDRVFRRGAGPMGMMTAGGAIAAVGALILAGAHHPVGAVAGLALITAGGGAGALAALAGLPPLSPPRLAGSVTAVYFAFVSLVGAGLGPLVTGVLSDRFFPGERGLGAALAVVVLTAAATTAALGLAAAPRWRRLAKEVQVE